MPPISISPLAYVHSFFGAPCLCRLSCANTLRVSVSGAPIPLSPQSLSNQQIYLPSVHGLDSTGLHKVSHPSSEHGTTCRRHCGVRRIHLVLVPLLAVSLTYARCLSALVSIILCRGFLPLPTFIPCPLYSSINLSSNKFSTTLLFAVRSVVRCNTPC
jgi:hypothetical protein